jgi:hypothetical protein
MNYNSHSTVQNNGTFMEKTKNQGKGSGPPGVAVETAVELAGAAATKKERKGNL